jgi:hypothetical protein
MTSIAASRNRAIVWSQASLSGSINTKFRRPSARLSTTARPAASNSRIREPVSRASLTTSGSRNAGSTAATASPISRASRAVCATRLSTTRLRYESR